MASIIQAVVDKVVGFFKKKKIKREIVVNIEKLETRVAVLENGRLEEYMIEHPRESLNEGSPVDKFRKEWQATIPPEYPKFEYKCIGCQGVDGELAHLMFQTCGLCAIKYLRKIGVEALKVPLRGDEETKLNVVKTVSQVMNAENPTREFCRSLIHSDSFCNSKFSCYYEVPEEDK